MPELETALRQLGASVGWPATPDLASAVRRRIVEPVPRRFPRALAVALAVLVVAVGAVLVVPSARTTVLEWLGIKGVKVTRVDKLPPTQPRSELGLGERVTLAQARLRAPWLLEPHLDELGPPHAVYVNRSVPGGQVSFLWGTERAVELLLTQSPGEPFAQKLLGPGTETDRVDVNGSAGVWFRGREHVFIYRDRDGLIREETARLVAKSLLWQRGEVTLRLEGNLTKAQALRIARSVRS